MLSCVEAFIEDVRGICAENAPEEETWTRVRDRMLPLLREKELKAAAADWPDSLAVDGKPGNLLFYEDPDHGFVINALIKAPGARTSIHDHGKSWTLYGVLEGGEDVLRFDRKDDGPQVPDAASIEEASRVRVDPGYIDFAPPWAIHAEYNGDERTVAVIVRSQRSGTFVQNRFQPEEGTVDQYDGPVQIPYEL